MAAETAQPKAELYAMMDPAAGRAVIMTLDGKLLHTLEVGRDPIGQPQSAVRVPYGRFLNNRDATVIRNVDRYPYSEFYEYLVHQHQVDQGMGLASIAVDTELPKDLRAEAAQALVGDLFFNRRIRRSVRARLLYLPFSPDWDILVSGVKAFEKFMREVFSHQASLDAIAFEAEQLGFPKEPLDAGLHREVVLEDGYEALVKVAETQCEQPFITWMEQAIKLSPVIAEQKSQDTLRLWCANVMANFHK